MCPWVGPHAPSFGRQLRGLPSRVEYLSPQGVLLPLVYGTAASPLWLELRGLPAWQATPSWTVYRLACHRLLPWLRVTFAMVPEAAWPGSDQWPWGTAPAAGPVGRLGCPSAPDPWGVGSFLSLGRPTCASVCGVLGHLAPVHRCARLVHCFACAVSWATWLLFTSMPARCVVLLVRCPGPLGSCSPVCPLGVLLCLGGVLGYLARVHWCARSVCCVACAVSWATWLLFSGVPARSVACVCGVLGQLAPVHRCARLVRCFACAVSWATWLLFTGVPAWCVVLLVRCPGPLGFWSPVCPLGALFCLCGLLGHLAPVHQCARSVRCFACAVSWATWLLLTGVRARCVALSVQCPGPLGSCSPVCPLGALLCACGVLGHLAPVHRCAFFVRCFACVVSWATWLLVTGVRAWCVVLLVRCPGPLGSCSPVCPLGVLCCVCGVLGHLAAVHQCARLVRCFACAVSWATGILFTDVPSWCVVLLVRCPGPLGSWPPVCALGALFCLRGVLGHLASVQRCARSVRCFACAVSWATSLQVTGVRAPCAALRVWCAGHLAPVHRCAFLVRCFACAVSWATWLLVTGVRAWCVVLLVRCPGPLGSCSPVCPLGVLCCVCGVPGQLPPVHRCARSVCRGACAVSWAPWLLFNGALAQCAVRCPGPLGSCSPVCLLGVLCFGLRVRGVAAGRSLVHPDGGYS